jgi:hypothetical protein
MMNRNRSGKAPAQPTCRQMTDLVYGYVTDSLKPKLKRELERHLSICPDCVNFLKTYKKTVSTARGIEQSEIPARVRKNVLDFLRQRIRRLGALLLYVLSQLVT